MTKQVVRDPGRFAENRVQIRSFSFDNALIYLEGANVNDMQVIQEHLRLGVKSRQDLIRFSTPDGKLYMSVSVFAAPAKKQPRKRETVKPGKARRVH